MKTNIGRAAKLRSWFSNQPSRAGHKQPPSFASSTVSSMTKAPDGVFTTYCTKPSGWVYRGVREHRAECGSVVMVADQQVARHAQLTEDFAAEFIGRMPAVVGNVASQDHRVGVSMEAIDVLYRGRESGRWIQGTQGLAGRYQMGVSEVDELGEHAKGLPVVALGNRYRPPWPRPLRNSTGKNPGRDSKPPQDELDDHRVGNVDEECPYQWHDYEGSRGCAELLGHRGHVGDGCRRRS